MNRTNTRRKRNGGSNKENGRFAGCLTSLLNNIDMYGRCIHLNFSEQHSDITTSFGGLMTMLMVIVFINYSALNLNMMMKMNSTSYSVNDYQIDLKELDNVSMDNYRDSFNMFFGTTNEQLDWFDNPYVSMNVYDLSQNWNPQISQKIGLRKCLSEEMLKVVTESAQAYYPNSLCFEDKA